jgi:serine/threonine-protein kinase
MPLASGTKLGPYEIVAPLGAGGMGEVYRARDARLERTVAIKVLPTHLSADPVRKLRFEREAKIISSLNHPHICVLHDVGNQDGIDFLVMEFLEGETLAKRLEKGSLPLDHVLKYGAQIADALDKAHRNGLVHRDLKPGNIMLTPVGSKLLDFGLAEPAAMASAATLTTATVPSPATERGTIVGTFQYMSPEQLRGKELDGRSDIFSLGAVLYEMVTGQRAFQGDSHLSIASAILEKRPEPISKLKPMMPPALDHAIRTCLAKDREERWQTARDLALELKWIAESGSQAGLAAADTPHRKLRQRLAWIVPAALGIALVGTLVLLYRRAQPVPASFIRLSVDLGAEVVETGWASGMAISPDASQLVFVSHGRDEPQRLYLRALDGATAMPLQGTENARAPFFSPDGYWLAFFAGGKLKRMTTTGGVPATVADAPSTRGGGWGDDGSIIFAPSNRSPLFRVSSAGGAALPVTELRGEWTHRFPQVLPEAKAILFTSCRTLDFETCTVEAQSLSSGQRKVLVQGGYYGRYLPSGHLLYVHQGAVFATPMNAKRLELTGPASPVLDDVSNNLGTGAAHFDFSRSGILVYIPGKPWPPNRSLFWMDASGHLTPLGAAPPRTYEAIRVSPDGTLLALVVTESSQKHLWIYDWARERLYRLTFLNGNAENPVWTADSKHLAFSADGQAPGPGIYWIRADGAGEAQRLLEGSNLIPRSFSPDGYRLAYDSFSTGIVGDTSWAVPLETRDPEKPKAGKPEKFLASSGARPAFSPDGRWIAYMNSESGTPEIYVRPFPSPDGRWLISSGASGGEAGFTGAGSGDGGFTAYWSRNGRELFYTNLEGKIMVVSYSAKGGTFSAGQPRLWSPRRAWSSSFGRPSNLDLVPDGKRFAVILPTGQDAEPQPQTHVVFLLNFFDELRRRVPPR